jgi:hypothetical protein
MSLPYAQPEARLFAADVAEFGTIRRTNVLGCTVSPAIEVVLDDGRRTAYIGKNVLRNVVDPNTGSTALGETHELPLDVKLVGNQYLTSMNIPAAAQEALFAKWRSLPQEQQKLFSSQWFALDKSDPASVQTFVTGMVALLQG